MAMTTGIEPILSGFNVLVCFCPCFAYINFMADPHKAFTFPFHFTLIMLLYADYASTLFGPYSRLTVFSSTRHVSQSFSDALLHFQVILLTEVTNLATNRTLLYPRLNYVIICGAACQIRTDDLLLTRQLL